MLRHVPSCAFPCSPPNFDFHSLLAAQRSHPIWGEYAASLLSMGFSNPKGELLAAAAAEREAGVVEYGGVSKMASCRNLLG